MFQTGRGDRVFHGGLRLGELGCGESENQATGKRRGFGFVEMPVADAAKAIAALNDKEYQQRTLKVREANDKRDRDEKDVNDVDA